VRLLGTNVSRGLSRREAGKRRRSLGKNELWQVQRTSAAPLLFGEFLDYAAILLLITTAVAALFERKAEAVLIAVLLVVSALLRGGTALTARRIFESYGKENIPLARIIRDGRYLTVYADEVVPGDILILSPGDTAVCDARLLQGELQVLETALTESRHPVKKSALHILPPEAPCEMRSNMVFASSVVVTGTARAAAVVTGERTYAFAREGYIPVRTEQTAGVLEKLSGWCRSVSLIMIGAVLLITLGGYFWGRNTASLDSLFLSALALAVASMSEFLCVVANIILAGSMRMLKKNSDGHALVKNADAAEKFARAGCVVFSSEETLVGDRCFVDRWYTEGEWKDAPQEGKGDRSLLSLLKLADHCFGSVRGALVSQDGDTGAESESSVLLKKLLLFCGGTSPVSSLPPLKDASDFGGLRTVLLPSDSGLQAYVCGELRDVLACCTYQHRGGEICPITAEERQMLLSEADACERRCARTMAVAVRTSPYDNLAKASALHNKMTLIGFVVAVHPVELSLVRYVSACRESGTRLAVLTESPVRARCIASEAGILAEKDRFIDLTAGEDSLREWLTDGSDCCAVIALKAETDRMALIRTIQESVPELVYVGARQKDLSACAQANTSVAAFLSGKTCPACLYRRADAFAGRETEEGGSRSSAALESLRIIGYCRGAFANLRGAAEYLLLSQTLRLCLVLASVLLGHALFSPVLLLVWGLLLDYAAVMTFAFRAPRLADLRTPYRYAALPAPVFGFMFPIAAGVLTAVLLAAVPAVASSLGMVFSPAEILFILYAGGLLASLLAAVLLLFEKSAGLRINASELVYLVLFVLTAAGVWLHLGLTWSRELGILLLFGLIPAVLLGLLYRVYKAYRSGRDRFE